MVGLRAGWAAAADASITNSLTPPRQAENDLPARVRRAEKALNAAGPFIPLLQPGNKIAAKFAAN